MRHSMRALFALMLVGWICDPMMAAESSRKWWHFGQGRKADATLPPQSAPPTTAPTQGMSPQTTPSQVSPASATMVSTTIDQPSTLPGDLEEVQPEPHWMINSPLAKVSWPRLAMPELPKPALPASPWSDDAEVNPNRNAWAEPSPEPLKPSPIRRFGQRTRAAWDKTVDALTPGDEPKSNAPSSRVARPDEPSMWTRMFGSNEPKKKEGSQTIGEFIAQERVDP